MGFPFVLTQVGSIPLSRIFVVGFSDFALLRGRFDEKSGVQSWV